MVNHLLDEERHNFRVRIDYILHRPGEDPLPIDPQGWVSERCYNERDWGESLLSFMEERRKSIVWLAHDFLHMRQLVELHHAHAVQLGAPYSVEYAGRW